MVRLLALGVVALFATSNAALLSTSEQLQLVTNQGSPVHATQGWSYEDCGQSYLARRLYHSLFILLPPLLLKVRQLILSKLTQLPCSPTLRNPDKT